MLPFHSPLEIEASIQAPQSSTLKFVDARGGLAIKPLAERIPGSAILDVLNMRPS